MRFFLVSRIAQCQGHYKIVAFRTSESGSQFIRLAALERPPVASVMLISTKEYKKTSMSFYT
jgi:hypothetical protein